MTTDRPTDTDDARAEADEPDLAEQIAAEHGYAPFQCECGEPVSDWNHLTTREMRHMHTAHIVRVAEAAARAETTTDVRYVYRGTCLLCGDGVLESGEHIDRDRHAAEVERILQGRAETTAEHEHDWKRRRNVTSRGYALPPIEVCQTEGCDAARSAEATTATTEDAHVLAVLNALHPEAAAPSLDYWGTKADKMRTALRAAGRAETTTATTEDAEDAIEDLAVELFERSHEPSFTDDRRGMDEAREWARRIVAGLHATTRTRPTYREEPHE